MAGFNSGAGNEIRTRVYSLEVSRTTAVLYPPLLAEASYDGQARN